jgi:hypothetical protein
MTDTIIQLTEEEFAARYPLRTNHLNPTAGWANRQGIGCLFETYSAELAFLHQQNPRTVWTLLDDGDGGQYVESGFHLVNRIGYLVSTVPVPERMVIQVSIPTQSEDAVKMHTPEPWFVQLSDHPGGLLIKPIPGQVVAQCDEVPEMEANARRICAAVNACEGIGTQALERGIIADLRRLLGELVTAAGDLDAAIDGVTDQFHAERARLNATIQATQSAIDAGTEIDLDDLLAGHRKIAIVWCIEDVQDVRPDLTDEQAWEVLRQVKRNHDAGIGINWYTLEWNAEDLFGDAPETDAEEE